jgi:SAM-dependent methyltransferase
VIGVCDAPWYTRFFGQDYLRAYAPYIGPERTARDVDGIVALLDLPSGGAVLDLCCGQGRHAIALAERGYRVTGLDLSEALLDRARADADARGVSVRWVRADMRDIPFEGEFDAVVNLFSSFGYLESEQDDRRVLRQIHEALVPGGRFLLELAHRDDLARRYAHPTVESDRHPDGVRVVWTSQFHIDTGRYVTRGVVHFPDGRTAETYHSYQAYAPDQLAGMLEDAGLPVRACLGGLDGSALAADSRRLVIVSAKR